MRKNEAKWYDSAKRWQIKIQKDGERRTFFSSTKGTKGKIAAEKAADAWLESGLVSESTKCGELLDAYFGHISKSTSKSNANQQENFVKNYLKPAIAAKKIKKLTLLDLQAIIDNAYAQKNLSQKTLKNLRGCISGFIKYCRLGNYTNLNTADLTIPRSAKRPSKEILARSSIQTLFTKDVTQFRGALQADWCIHAYRLAVLEGLRPGELLGLRWEDLNGSTLTIHQSINDLGEVTDGKNENANRTIVLTGLAMQEIEAQRKQLHDRGMVCKWIFPNEKCQPFRQKAFRNRWYKYCETNQISAVTPYELRHTFVSICDEMPDGLKKQVVGHSRNMDTNGIYGHRKTGDLERAAAYSDAAFRAIL